MVTILDVAKEAQVSASTVSRVLNNIGNISEKTSRRVLEAVEKLGYEPNLLARSFRRGETRIILVLLPNITNPYYAHILSGISDATRKLGYSSFICNTQGERKQEKEVLDMLGRKRADGAILLATDFQADFLQDYADKYPIVQCSEYDPEIPISHVCIDNYRAARDVVAYLLNLGHRRIGLISSENAYISTQLRRDGYCDELRAQGIGCTEDLLYYASVDYSFESGLMGAKKLLSQPKRPSALFCISDVLAQGAIEAAAQLGLRVPQDITVVGFDDVEQTTRYHPYVTTMAQPCYEIGRTAAELLSLKIDGEAEDVLEYLLPHKLIIRESSARCALTD